MDERPLSILFGVLLCFVAGTLLIFQPVWFWRGVYRYSGYGKAGARQREADLRLLFENRPEFMRRFFGIVLIMRFMGIVWYVGALVFLLS